MKVKTIMSAYCPEQVRCALESPELVNAIIKRVLVMTLRVPHPGEADFFLCPTILALPRHRSKIGGSKEYGCEIRLTGVQGQSAALVKEDYEGAIDWLVDIYASTIENKLHIGQTCELNATIKFDTVHRNTPAFLNKSVVVEGQMPLPKVLSRPASALSKQVLS